MKDEKQLLDLTESVNFMTKKLMIMRNIGLKRKS